MNDAALSRSDLSRSLTLPDDLYDAIKHALATMPTERWKQAAQAVSARYRAPRDGGVAPCVTNAAHACGYAALIMPATYAQLRGAMASTAAGIPAWRPTTLLDMGSGPGTALWAATAQWSTLHMLTAWEREQAFITLGRTLAQGSTTAAVRAAHWERVDLRHRPVEEESGYDLVVLGHVLNELDPAARQTIIAAAWRLTNGVLLIVEPGTPAAFDVVRAAREQVIAAGGWTIAPCAHDHPCPLAHDWCHFPQRLVRPDFQRRARGAPSPWEESKFSYAALARFAPQRRIWGRVIREPVNNKAYAEITISAQEGIVQHRVLKRHRDAFRQVRAVMWGDIVLAAPPDLDSSSLLPRNEHEAQVSDTDAHTYGGEPPTLDSYERREKSTS